MKYRIHTPCACPTEARLRRSSDRLFFQRSKLRYVRVAMNFISCPFCRCQRRCRRSVASGNLLRDDPHAERASGMRSRSRHPGTSDRGGPHGQDVRHCGIVPRPLVPVSTQDLPYASATTLWMRSNTRAAQDPPTRRAHALKSLEYSSKCNYSITSSACASNNCGTSRPSALGAV